MNGRVLPFEGSAHDEAQRLLPWLVNGRLDARERAWLLPHLENCGECRSELAALHALQDQVRSTAHPAPDVEAGWQRMRVRLRPERAPVAARSYMAILLSRFAWRPLLIGVQAVAIAVLGVMLWRTSPPQDRQPARYRTLGAEVPNAQLVVVFDGSVREARLRRLLQASGARIVDGPNAAGAYTLAVPATRAASVRDALRTSPDVVLVESLQPGAQR